MSATTLCCSLTPCTRLFGVFKVLKKIGTAYASVLDYNIHEYAHWDDRVSRGFIQHELPGLCKNGAAVVIKYIIVNCGFQICWY